MRHVIRGGGSNAGRQSGRRAPRPTHRRTERTRVAALIATFLLLVAGVLVTAPGLMTASASGSSKPANVDDGKGGGKDDDGGNGDDENQDETTTTVIISTADHHENECENEDENQDEHEAEDENQAEDERPGRRRDQGGEGDDFKATMAGVDNNGGDESKADDENQAEDEDQAEDENQNEDENEDDDETSTTVDDDEECPVDATSIQAYKSLGDDHGGADRCRGVPAPPRRSADRTVDRHPGHARSPHRQRGRCVRLHARRHPVHRRHRRPDLRRRRPHGRGRPTDLCAKSSTTRSHHRSR